MSEEIWKDVPDYEGLYEASSHGRIRSKEGKVTYRRRGNSTIPTIWTSRVLKEKNPNKNGRRDKRVDLWKDGKSKTLLVSRIVAITFIPNPDNKKFINHIDGDHRNNHVENLEWTTSTENNNHAFDNDLIGTNIRIKLIRKSDNKKYEFRSMARASEFLGRNKGYISSLIKRGKSFAECENGYRYEIIIPN